MKKFKAKKIALTNHKTPFPIDTLHERLIKAKAIDMRDNYRIVETFDGYIQVLPIDNTKLYK
ncbi:hypothetical protein [Sporosarcina obsidiansis]|uniref:hypothetical protein n=1 Tax=Sporosarcina obsidiansis TaxID=2660748 RepID=UPI00129A4215|nr:hypothetical protein [Sporosarcina obsidiansis]